MFQAFEVSIISKAIFYFVSLLEDSIKSKIVFAILLFPLLDARFIFL